MKDESEHNGRTISRARLLTGEIFKLSNAVKAGVNPGLFCVSPSAVATTA
jgi:hypothetical protein